MKAAVVTRQGAPGVIEFIDLPTPCPGPGEVLIKVLACGVSRLDHHIRRGALPLDQSLPHLLGMDAVGEVAELGQGATDFAVGTRVIAMPGYPARSGEWVIRPAVSAPSFALLGLQRPGTYAQYMVAPQRWVIADDSGLPPEQVAALPSTLLTAIRAVRDLGAVKAGDRVLVLADACTTGALCVQVAKALGAWVAVAVRSQADATLARQCGANRVIDRTEEDLGHWHGGLALVVDCREPWHPDAPQDLPILDGARWVQAREMADIEDLKAWMHQVRSGRIRPLVDRVLPLSEAAQAHELMAANRTQGSVVLLPWCH